MVSKLIYNKRLNKYQGTLDIMPFDPKLRQNKHFYSLYKYLIPCGNRTHDFRFCGQGH